MLKHMYICIPHNFCRIDSQKCNCWDIGSKFLFFEVSYTYDQTAF